MGKVPYIIAAITLIAIAYILMSNQWHPMPLVPQ